METFYFVPLMSIENLYKLFLDHPKVITDSRKIEPACLFFALKGGNFNGNQFASDALTKGAAYAIIDEEAYQYGEKTILVKDVLTTLQELANYHRKQFDIPVIGITGSNGKTTTKELVSVVLNSHYPTHFTKGNFNNHIGVPLTLLEMPLSTEVAIIEMGANHIGEIDFLCQIAAPTHGLITNIGSAHLEGFGSLEGVKQAKSELYRYLETYNGLAFVNLDEAYLSDLVKGVKFLLPYLRSEEPNPQNKPYETKFIEANPFVKVAFLSEDKALVEVQSQLIGDYNFNNIMTAISIGKYFKVPAQKIKQAIEAYTPKNNRSQVLKKEGNTFILDAYNANPTSMRGALDNLHQMPASSKIAILGDMLELGDYSREEHLAILEYASNYDFEKIALVGKEFKKIIPPKGVLQFENTSNLKEWFDSEGFVGQLILIKGSRGIGLEKLLD